VLAIFAITLLASGQSVEGTGDATVTVNNVFVPFTIEIDGTGADVHSDFFNLLENHSRPYTLTIYNTYCR
jgi:hypothetical protein